MKLKKNVHCFGREQEIPKIFPTVWEPENHAFPLENILEREFLFMPDPGSLQTKHLKRLEICIAPSNTNTKFLHTGEH